MIGCQKYLADPVKLSWVFLKTRRKNLKIGNGIHGPPKHRSKKQSFSEPIFYVEIVMGF
jgi:hypothetical protein